MPINLDAVGKTGAPQRRSWTSDDALLYAVGVGAGTDELAFTTENTGDIPQRVLPTMAVILGGGGVPFGEIGEFNAAYNTRHLFLCWKTLRQGPFKNGGDDYRRFFKTGGAVDIKLQTDPRAEPARTEPVGTSPKARARPISSDRPRGH